jgi:mRNA interferase HigB
MIVIGTDLVERYFADRAGHRGIKVALTQYEAWLSIAMSARWCNPQDVKSTFPKASILRAVLPT